MAKEENIHLKIFERLKINCDVWTLCCKNHFDMDETIRI